MGIDRNHYDSENKPEMIQDQNIACYEKFHQKYDLVIIGAGPAGLFCAINSCQPGKKILLLEKKSSPGRKLLISGSGHCNITHGGDISAFFDHYGGHGRFLRPALLSFTNLDLISFFAARGLAMAEDKNGKVFPESMRSRDVLNILVEECRSKNISLECGCDVLSVNREGDGFLICCTRRAFKSRILVIATGGRSYPATGSTGDGYGFAADLGHSIVETAPALVPVFVKDYPFSELSGLSFPNLNISLYRQKRIVEAKGDLLFTHQGLSGPVILDLSRHIRPGDTLKLSFLPEEMRPAMHEWLMKKAGEEGARKLGAVLAASPYLEHLPTRLIKRILELQKIPADMGSAHLSREMRQLLVERLAGFPMVVTRLGGYDQAMVTRGGVELLEVNPKTMESRLVKGLFLIGEVLDIDGDTGGYNLQAAFSTAMLAARSISEAI
jgi:predicted Rossmann fold flavoprotein